jgi:acyl-CoA thioester hydrolase
VWLRAGGPALYCEIVPADRATAFSQTFRVRYDECGPGGGARASTYLRYLQELAFAHSAALGYPLSWYETQRLFWLMRRVHLAVYDGARYGEDLRCTTQVVGMRRVLARRRNWVERASGERVAEAAADWIFTREGVAMARIPDDFVAAFPALEMAVVPSALPDRHPPSGASYTTLRLRAGDEDAMGHANHAVYLDLLDDAVSGAGGAAAVAMYPRAYEVQYHAAARSGVPLRHLAWPEAVRWHYRLESPDGRLFLYGRLDVGPDRAPSSS